jgi:disulfide oxidoreductase YuzD
MNDSTSIAAVLVHVPVVADALDWYERALRRATRRRLGEPRDFEYLDVGPSAAELQR